MVMRRIFGRKKKDDEEEEEEKAEAEVAEAEEVVAEEEVTEEVPEEAELAPEVAGETIPYHDSIQDRLMYMFGASMGTGVEAPDEFRLEFMAMGERFNIDKKSMGDIELKTGTVADEDVFIRIGNDVVTELLSAATFQEFSELYMKYYKNAEPGKFVKIELRKAVSNLNRMGYARVPLLKLLIGVAR
jgi:hypothetical protein